MSLSIINAVNLAMDELLEKDQSIVIFGEDVGYFGGVFRATSNLQQKYGDHRVFDAPISEQGIVSVAIGMAVNGLRPVIEIQFADYIFPAYDQIISELCRIRYRSEDGFKTPITIRTPCGGGIYGGQTHSMSIESYFLPIPGLYMVMPSNPKDAYALLKSSIICDDPVLFLEPKRIYNGPFSGFVHAPSQSWNGHIDAEFDQNYKVDLVDANYVTRGSDVTLIAYGSMVHLCKEAIKMAEGINIELIDLRTLWPIDIDKILSSVKKTGRVVIVHEAPRTGGLASEITTIIQEACFWDLKAPIARVTGWDTPYPHAHEWAYFPSPERIFAMINKIVKI